MKRAEEKQNSAAEYDVVVAGGGTAGVVAAIAASRSGAKTILIERNNCLGGTTTSGLIIQFGGGGLPYMTGVLKEIVEELISNNEAKYLGEPNVNIPFNPEALKDLLFEKLGQSGADLLLYTQIVDTIVVDKKIAGVVIENKSGRSNIYAKAVVDATGDADVTALSGAPCINLNNGGLLGARVANIDYNELLDYMKSNQDQLCENDLEKPLIRMVGFFDLVEQGFKDGILEPDMMKIPEYLLSVEGTHEGNKRYLRIDGAFPERGTAMIGYGAAVQCDSTDALSLTKAEIEARRRNKVLLQFLRQYIPGFKNAYIIQTAQSMAIWASRRIVGEYVLTSEDIHSHKRFDDVVVHAHANSDHRTLHIKVIEFDIPYRSLIPKDIDNLIVVGRCISTTRDAKIPGINIPISMQMGEVAGIAAAASAKSKVALRNLSVKDLQNKLREKGLLARVG